jgi:hypothetical protein
LALQLLTCTFHDMHGSVCRPSQSRLSSCFATSAPLTCLGARAEKPALVLRSERIASIHCCQFLLGKPCNMFRGRGRGRGPGGRGRSGGRGGRSGPRLPVKLTRELLGEEASNSGGRGGAQLSRKERRRAERQSRKTSVPAGRPEAPQSLPARQRQAERPASKQGKGVDSGGDGPPAKRQKRAGSNFEALLPEHLQVCTLGLPT